MAKQKLIRIKQSELARIVELLSPKEDECLIRKLGQYIETSPITLEKIERHRLEIDSE